MLGRIRKRRCWPGLEKRGLSTSRKVGSSKPSVGFNIVSAMIFDTLQCHEHIAIGLGGDRLAAAFPETVQVTAAHGLGQLLDCLGFLQQVTNLHDVIAVHTSSCQTEE